jgi:hypothetical protein
MGVEPHLIKWQLLRYSNHPGSAQIARLVGRLQGMACELSWLPYCIHKFFLKGLTVLSTSFTCNMVVLNLVGVLFAPSTAERSLIEEPKDTPTTPTHYTSPNRIRFGAAVSTVSNKLNVCFICIRLFGPTGGP